VSKTWKVTFIQCKDAQDMNDNLRSCTFWRKCVTAEAKIIERDVVLEFTRQKAVDGHWVQLKKQTFNGYGEFKEMRKEIVATDQIQEVADDKEKTQTSRTSSTEKSVSKAQKLKVHKGMDDTMVTRHSSGSLSYDKASMRKAQTQYEALRVYKGKTLTAPLKPNFNKKISKAWKVTLIQCKDAQKLIENIRSSHFWQTCTHAKAEVFQDDVVLEITLPKAVKAQVIQLKKYMFRRYGEFEWMLKEVVQTEGFQEVLPVVNSSEEELLVQSPAAQNESR